MEEKQNNKKRVKTITMKSELTEFSINKASRSCLNKENDLYPSSSLCLTISDGRRLHHGLSEYVTIFSEPPCSNVACV